MGTYADEIARQYAVQQYEATLNISGAILSVRHFFSGNDELTVTVYFKNPFPILREFRVYLLDTNKNIIDKEPDFSWKNVSGNASSTITVNTIGRIGTARDLGGEYTVELREQGMGVVDSKTVSLVTGEVIGLSAGIVSPDTPPPTSTPSLVPKESKFDLGSFFTGAGTGIGVTGVIAIAAVIVLLARR